MSVFDGGLEWTFIGGATIRRSGLWHSACDRWGGSLEAAACGDR